MILVRHGNLKYIFLVYDDFNMISTQF